MDTEYSFKLEGGGLPPEVMVVDSPNPPRVVSGTQSLKLDNMPRRMLLFVPPDGFWDMVVESTGSAAGSCQIEFPRLPQSGPLGWWHRVHGLSGAARFGAGAIRIGVVDEGLSTQRENSCIGHVNNIGSEAWSPQNHQRALNPLTQHGHAICSILSSRVNGSGGYRGIVSDADIWFAAAGEETTPTLGLPRVLASIRLLVEKYACDVISISAGDWLDPIPDLETEVELAADRGTLCFLAAGNQGEVRYPAKYPVCLAVAALGQAGNAPTGSTVEYLDQHSSEFIRRPLYLWDKSARGPAVEFCAPGVGVIWNNCGAAARASFGTSYACPIAAGVAARILAGDARFMHAPRDRQRYDYGLQVLAASCKAFGSRSEQSYWKYGRLVAP